MPNRMETIFTEYGWMTKSIVRKYYRVKTIGALMFVDQWVDSSLRIFPNNRKRLKCNICKTDWQDIPILEKVYIVIFENKHRNKIVCNKCRCKILNTMERLEKMK